jgi:hypothetical protein
MKPAFWAAVLLVLLATSLIRFRLLETPLERDEGEYAYSGQLMLEGIPPYQLACNMKLPGTYAAYAVLMAVLGQTITGIHVGLLLVNSAAIVLIALLGRRLFGTASGVAACAAYALMSVGSEVMGTQAHATHFVVLAALGGVLSLLSYSDSRRLVTLGLSGLLFGLAFLMKQPGIFFGVFGVLYVAAIEWRNRRQLPLKLIVFLGALAAPFGLTCLLLWRAGVFEKFWFWTFTYARAYASEISPAEGLRSFAIAFLFIVKENAALWLLAVVGLMRLRRKESNGPSAAFAIALLFFSFLAVCPGLHFRGHYFILLFPSVALLAGATVRERLSYFVFAVALLASLLTQREFLFRANPHEANRIMYGRNLCQQAIPVASYIRAHSNESSRVAILGSEPEIYFYAHRHSATSYIYTYGLMESQPYALSMQQDMIREIVPAAPEFMVEVVGGQAWLRDEKSPTHIFKWWSDYRPQHYRLVGVADRISYDQTEYRWDAAAEGYQPRSQFYMLVYRRKDALAATSGNTK